MSYKKIIILSVFLTVSLRGFSQTADNHEDSVTRQLKELEVQQTKDQKADFEKTGIKNYNDARSLDNKTSDQQQELLQVKGYEKPVTRNWNDRHGIVVKTTLDAWVVKGKQQFSVIDPDGRKVSQLDYPVNGGLWTLNNEVSFYDKLGFSFSITDSLLSENKGIDRDWYPSIRPDTWLESNFSSKPSVRIYDFRFFYRLVDFNPGKSYFRTHPYSNEDRFYLDVFSGWMSQSDKHPMTNGQWQIENWANSSDTIAGLDSYYNIRYGGPFVGVTLQGVARNGLIGKAQMSTGLLQAKSQGYWNLRDYSYSQKGIGFSLNARYDLFFTIKYFKIGIGWKYAYYKISELKESGTMPGYSYSNENIIRDVIYKTSGPVLSLEYTW
jgi:hypothetical protein